MLARPLLLLLYKNPLMPSLPLQMNPADAYRKTQRAKEIARNKKERKFQRDAHALQVGLTCWMAGCVTA